MLPTQFLSEQLSQEHSKVQAQRLSNWIGHDADRLAALVEIMLGTNQRLTQRAAWVLGFVADRAPYLLEPWLPKMVAKMREPGIHVAVKRNVIRILQDMEIPDAVLDDVTDVCFEFLADPQEAVAVRVFSMTVLGNVCHKIPELKSELRLLIEEHWYHSTPAFRSRGKKVLKQLGPE